jgi:hypothetical protein
MGRLVLVLESAQELDEAAHAFVVAANSIAGSS